MNAPGASCEPGQTADQRVRQASIDVLRAVAIALMVVVHFAENLAGASGPTGSVFEGAQAAWWLPTGFAAPTFTLLVGVSYRLWLGQQPRRTDLAISKTTVRRGLFLIGLGFAFNVLIWLPEDVFNWDILTLIGCGLLVLEAARRMPGPVVILAAVLVALVAPALRVAVDYDAFWTAGYFDYEFTLPDVALGWLVTGYFPIFPWLSYPLVGFAVAPLLSSGRRTLALVGGGCVAAAVMLLLAWPALPPVVTGEASRGWTMFPASSAYVLGTLGGVILTLTALHRLLDGPVPRCRGLVNWARPLSRHSLSLYLVHHAVHIWPLWVAGFATTGDPAEYWQVAMPVRWAIGLAALFLAAAAVVCRWADRRRLPTAEALMRWVCD